MQRLLLYDCGVKQEENTHEEFTETCLGSMVMGFRHRRRRPGFWESLGREGFDYDTLVRYMEWQDVGQVWATGCGSRSLMERSEFGNMAYKIGANL